MAYYGKFRKRRGMRAYRRRSSVTAKRGVKKAVKSVRRRNFAKAVKSVVARQTETKVVNNSTVQRAIYNVNASQFTSSIIPLGPGSGTPYLFQVSQGTKQGERIADCIATKRLLIKGDYRINTYFNANTNYNPVPGYVTMWVVKLKPFLNDDVSTLKAVIDGSFYQSGNGSVGMTGTLPDLYRQPNNQQITVIYKKTYKVGTSQVIASSAVSGGSDPSNQYWSNNDFPMQKFFSQDLTKAMPKKLAFNDANDNYVNRHSYLFWTFVRIDNQIPSTSLGAYSGVIPAYVDFECDFTYTDM